MTRLSHDDERGMVAGAIQEVELPDARPKERCGDSLPSKFQPRFIFMKKVRACQTQTSDVSFLNMAFVY
jgi:hypothetical protein